MALVEGIHMRIALLVHRRHDDDLGAAMVEYALLLAGIAVVVGAAVGLFGGRLNTVFGTF